MASDIWLRIILIVRKETRCRHIGYSFRLAAKVLLYASSHRQDSTYSGLCYTSRGALAGTRILELLQTHICGYEAPSEHLLHAGNIQDLLHLLNGVLAEQQQPLSVHPVVVAEYIDAFLEGRPGASGTERQNWH